MVTTHHYSLNNVINAIEAIAISKNYKDIVIDEKQIEAREKLYKSLKDLSDQIGDDEVLRNKIGNDLYWNYSEIPFIWIKELLLHFRSNLKPSYLQMECARCNCIFHIEMLTHSDRKRVLDDLKRCAKWNRISPLSICKGCK